jgi:hypothetical protein
VSVTVMLRLDDGSAAKVVRLWERLYVRGLESTLMQPDSEPRMPLASFPDNAPAESIVSAIDRLTGCWQPITVSITGITIIGSLSPVLSLSVAPTQALLALHEQLHRIMVEQPCDARWRPGCWTPAIVVSEWATSVAEAVKCLLPVLVEPFAGALVALELVHQPSGTVMAGSDFTGW